MGQCGTHQDKSLPCLPCMPPPHTCLLDYGLQPGHGDDSDPDRHERAQEVTKLQHIVLHDTEHHNARLVTGMVKLGKQGKGVRAALPSPSPSPAPQLPHTTLTVEKNMVKM